MANLEGDKSIYYNKGYYQGYRKATIDHLGGKCSQCGESNLFHLEIHHKNHLERKGRNLKDLENLDDLEIKCDKCHDTKWGKKDVEEPREE